MAPLADPAAAYRRVDFDAYVMGCGSGQLVQLCLADIDAALGRALWAGSHRRPDIRCKALERAQMALVALAAGIDADNSLAGALETFYRALIRRVTLSLGHFDAGDVAAMRGDIRDIAASFAA